MATTLNTYCFGTDAVLYYGVAGTDPVLAGELALSLMEVTDVVATLEKEDVDVSVRRGAGWAASAGKLKSCSLDFKMLFQPADVGFVAVETAYTGNGQIALAPCTDAYDTSDAEYIWGDFIITNLSREETLDGHIFVNVSAKMSQYGGLVTV